jgi:4-amino-4-deoxy-L-arabinose transferase-like glycosyltransferase
MGQRLRAPSAPLAALALVVLLSLGLRVAWIDRPCASPCRAPGAHTAIFDEVYYVGAAARIDGLAVPAGDRYGRAPAGVDPNAEHPQLVKLLIAGSIRLFGDDPLAWRLGSVIAGTLAILGMFALCLASGAGRWVGVLAAGLMASDNLLLVAGRIGTLDIYAVAAMVWALALYLRGRPLLAGIVLGVGTACKEVVPFALLVIALVEAGRWWSGGGGRRRVLGAAGRVGGCAAAMIAVFAGLLAAMDRIAPPYDYAAGHLLGGGVIGHIGHILGFAAQQSSPAGPRGIESLPWEWLVDYKPIVYLNINPARPAPGLQGIHPQAHFLGMISPALMVLALPALARAASSVLARAGSPWADARSARWLGDTPLVAVAWVLGTLGPFELLSLVWARTSYLYYMVLVMPGIYLAVAGLLVRARRRRGWLCTWGGLLVIALVVMYPFTPLPASIA